MFHYLYLYSIHVYPVACLTPTLIICIVYNLTVHIGCIMLMENNRSASE